jgi:hypothetical protein
MRKSAAKPRRKKAPKRVLALPDLEHSKAVVLSSLTSARAVNARTAKPFDLVNDVVSRLRQFVWW